MICPECGMGYVPDNPEDAKIHRKYHDKIVNGFYARRIKSDEIVWEESDYWITVVNYFSPPAQKKRAEEAGLVAIRDTSFDFAPYHSEEPLDERNVHIFLLYKNNRIVGFLVGERRCYVQKFTWEEYEKAGGKELPKREAIWSIGLVWVHRRHRRSGLGSKLVKAAVSYFNIEIQSVGWYTPFTDNGERLVKSLCSKSFYVAI